MPFAEQLKLLRTKAGLSQKDLGEKLGVRQQTIGHWESGAREGPSPDEFFRLCQVLGVDCSAFNDPPTSKKRKK